MAERRVTADGRILEKGPDGVVRQVGMQGAPQGGIIPIGPRNPTYPLEAPRLEGQMRNTDANTANTQVQTQRTAQQIELDRRRQALEELKAQDARQKSVSARQKEIEARKSMAKDLVYDLYTLDRIANDIQDSSVSPGFGEVGMVGNLLKNVPGTAARDIDNQLTALKSNIARSSLGRMREESPTGGAVGALNEGERKMFEYSRGALDQGDGYETFRRNLAEARARTWSELNRIAPGFAPKLKDNVFSQRRKQSAPSGRNATYNWDELP